MGTPSYTVTELPVPAKFVSTAASDISEDSVVVGSAGATPGLGMGPVIQSVMWKSGVPILIGDGSFNPSSATAVNGVEQLVGLFTVGSGAYKNHPFFYSSGQIKDLALVLGVLGNGAPSPVAYDINDAGVVVGVVSDGDAVGRGFIWDSTGNGPPTLLAPNTKARAINTAGSVVGDINSGLHAFIFRNGQVQILGDEIFPRGLSSTKEWVTGYRELSPGTQVRAFRVDASIAQPVFEAVGPTTENAVNNSSTGTAINDHGIAIGWVMLDGFPGGFVFVDFPSSSPFAGWHNLADVVTNGAGWTFKEATGINNKGEIAGSGTYQGQDRAFLLTPVNELSSFEKDLSRFEKAFMMLIGGVESGGGGKGITFGGKPHPIDPHEPFSALWAQAFRGNPDMLVGFVVERLASLSSNPKTRDLLDQTASQLLHGAFGQSE